MRVKMEKEILQKLGLCYTDDDSDDNNDDSSKIKNDSNRHNAEEEDNLALIIEAVETENLETEESRITENLKSSIGYKETRYLDKKETKVIENVESRSDKREEKQSEEKEVADVLDSLINSFGYKETTYLDKEETKITKNVESRSDKREEKQSEEKEVADVLDSLINSTTEGIGLQRAPKNVAILRTVQTSDETTKRKRETQCIKKYKRQSTEKDLTATTKRRVIRQRSHVKKDFEKTVEDQSIKRKRKFIEVIGVDEFLKKKKGQKKADAANENEKKERRQKMKEEKKKEEMKDKLKQGKKKEEKKEQRKNGHKKKAVWKKEEYKEKEKEKLKIEKSEIIREEDSESLKTNCSPASIKMKMLELEESEAHMKAIEELGFQSMSKITCTKMNLTLLNWMVQVFNPADTTLRINKQKIRIVAEDVHQVLGIPNGPVAVEEHSYSNNNDPDLKEWRMRYQRNNGPLTSHINNEVSLSKPADNFFKFNYIVFVVTKLFAPSNRSTCSFRVHKALRNGVENVKDMNWSAYVLATLAKEISQYKNKKRTENCGGCLYFLQMFYLDRFLYKGQLNVPRTIPAMFGWTTKLAKNRLNLELREGGFGRGQQLQRITTEEKPQKKEEKTSEKQNKENQEAKKKEEEKDEQDGQKTNEEVAKSTNEEENSFLRKIKNLYKCLKEAAEANQKTQSAILEICDEYPESTEELKKFLPKKSVQSEVTDVELFMHASQILDAMEYAKKHLLALRREQDFLRIEGDKINSDFIRTLEEPTPFKLDLPHKSDAFPKSINEEL